MMDIDKTALFCDLAETYHIFGFDSLPIEQIAMLAVGLREDSRIKQKMAGVSYPSLLLLSAMTADNLTLIRHGMALKDRKKPFLFLENIEVKEKKEITGFKTPEEFRKAWNKVMEG